MSLQDRIARALVRENKDLLEKTAGDGWNVDLDSVNDAELFEYDTCQIGFGKGAELVVNCQIADSPDLQTTGLQKHAELGAYDGMVFPYTKPKRVAFHMASVKFPIDIIFVGADNRVSMIADGIEPGTPGNWGMPRTSAVIEVNGGFCKAHGIEVGTEVKLLDVHDKKAQATFPTHPRKDINPQLVRDVMTDPEERFKGHDLPDVTLDFQPMDTNYSETDGYDVVKYHDDDENIAPVRPS